MMVVIFLTFHKFIVFLKCRLRNVLFYDKRVYKEKYAGNAIFLHVWREPDTSTGGYIAVSEENMVEILKILPTGTVVTIY